MARAPLPLLWAHLEGNVGVLLACWWSVGSDGDALRVGACPWLVPTRPQPPALPQPPVAGAPKKPVCVSRRPVAASRLTSKRPLAMAGCQLWQQWSRGMDRGALVGQWQQRRRRAAAVQCRRGTGGTCAFADLLNYRQEHGAGRQIKGAARWSETYAPL